MNKSCIKINTAKELRLKLHEIPEASGCELKTKALLTDFLKAYPELKLTDCGKWFYAEYLEAPGEKTIAFRADMDAVSGKDGKVFHGCGHDGHMSVMAALAAGVAQSAQSGEKIGKNIIFIFQHAEETGEGGAECAKLLKEKQIEEIYAFHNCPGFDEGAVLILKNSFACASTGQLISFEGAQTHAAYPENGINPVYAMAEFIAALPKLTDSSDYEDLVMVTPVELKAGARAFGVAAGSGETALTIRAAKSSDLEKLKSRTEETAKDLASRHRLRCSFEYFDSFPSTENSGELLEKVLKACESSGLKCVWPNEPFRWSEDFGWYGRQTKAFMLGIGGGTDAPGLHTDEYKWNDAVTESALKLFTEIIAE